MSFFTTIGKILHENINNNEKLLAIYHHYMVAGVALGYFNGNSRIGSIDIDEDHYFDSEYDLKTDYIVGALVCRKSKSLAPMEEFYTSYHYCPFCGQKLEAD